MRQKIEWKEFTIILSCLILAVLAILYNISREGFLGLSKDKWNIVWLMSENGMLLLFSLLHGMHFIQTIRYIFRFVFVPLFTVKLIYHFSCFTGLYLFSPSTWEIIWSFACGIVVLAGILLVIKKANE